MSKLRQDSVLFTDDDGTVVTDWPSIDDDHEEALWMEAIFGPKLCGRVHTSYGA